MNRKYWCVVFLLGFSFFPFRTSAQCKNQRDKTCWNLQYILYAAETDFREFRESPPLRRGDPKPVAANPDVSVGAAHVPCHVDTWWSSVVSVYMCSAELPAAEAEQWYATTMANLHELQYLWQFKTESPGSEHYVDAGPQGCEAAPLDRSPSVGPYAAAGPYLAEGPYFGQCPLHLHVIRNADGLAKVSFWLNSYTSANLVRNPMPPLAPGKSETLRASAPAGNSVAPVSPAATPASAAAASTPSGAAASDTSAAASSVSPAPNGPATPAPAPAGASAEASSSIRGATATAANRAVCDELCQGLKKILEDRGSAFRAIGRSSSVSAASGSSGVAVADVMKLSGAASCSVKPVASAGARSTAEELSTSGAKLKPVSTRIDAKSPGVAPAIQYVCYWPQDSEAAAEGQFRDLVGLLQLLMPTNWSAGVKNEAEELSGAPVTIWSASDHQGRAAAQLYLIGRSVGLHVSAGR